MDLDGADDGLHKRLVSTVAGLGVAGLVEHTTTILARSGVPVRHVAKGVVHDDPAADAAPEQGRLLTLGALVSPPRAEVLPAALRVPLEQARIDLLAGRGRRLDAPPASNLVQRLLARKGTQRLVEDGHRQPRPLAHEPLERVVVDYGAPQEREVGVVEVGVVVGRRVHEGAGQRLERYLLRQGQSGVESGQLGGLGGPVDGG